MGRVSLPAVHSFSKKARISGCSGMNLPQFRGDFQCSASKKAENLKVRNSGG
jgi:hypothetical protein